MPVAAECQRIGPAQELVPGLHVDHGVAVADRRGVVRGLGVQVVLVDGHIDAVEVVHEVAESTEVDHGHVVDLEPCEVLDGLERELRRARALELRAVREGRVDAVVPEPGDRHPQVAREREQRHEMPLGVDPNEHEGVRPRRRGAVRVAMIRADHEGDGRSVGLRQRLGEILRGDLDVVRIARDAGVVPVEPVRDDPRSRQHHEEDAGEAPEGDANPAPPLALPRRTASAVNGHLRPRATRRRRGRGLRCHRLLGRADAGARSQEYRHPPRSTWTAELIQGRARFPSGFPADRARNRFPPGTTGTRR